VTARFRVLYVFVIMEIGTRQLLYCNVTSHPTAAWTLQQFRETIPTDHHYQFLIHDRDSIFASDLDQELKTFRLKVLRTPIQAPKANAYCERLVGTLRRECLDFLIPLKHLRMMLKEWVQHYNDGRPHLSLGPGIPSPAKESMIPPLRQHQRRHQCPDGCTVHVRLDTWWLASRILPGENRCLRRCL